MLVKLMRSWVIAIVATIAAGSTVFAAHSDIDPSQVNVLQLPEWKMTTSNYGGKLLLSDSPEMVPADGIMYQDTVSGDARLFFHHVNATTEAKKIVVLLENSGSEPAQVTVLQHGLGGPSLDYLQVGKAVQTQYFAMHEPYLVEVPAKGATQLIYQLNDAVVEPNMLVNGMYDFYAEQPVTVKVMMMPVKENARKFAATAKVLPADQWRLRGTFDGKDRMLIPAAIYNPKEHGAVAITLADNKKDVYVKGIDATDGSEVLNYGNYGIVYRMFMPSESNGKVSYYLNPRGGEYAGALGIKYQYVPGQMDTPADRLFFGASTEQDMQLLGNFEGGQSLWFTFSPPGASNLPVKVILAPKH
ncbi:copper amine oxidase [Anaerospora hongkongensis]|uniref:copper amine oxidase n=1 Tax=Anaerospora hongkongensis TaxID=244830 RepID=UPI0028A2AC99|nr:copper amine oxidase [Anaerospora hongkongensis]